MLTALLLRKNSALTSIRWTISDQKIVPLVLKARLENKPACLQSIKSAEYPGVEALAVYTQNGFILLYWWKSFMVSKWLKSPLLIRQLWLLWPKSLKASWAYCKSFISNSLATPKALVVPACMILLRSEEWHLNFELFMSMCSTSGFLTIEYQCWQTYFQDLENHLLGDCGYYPSYFERPYYCGSKPFDVSPKVSPNTSKMFSVFRGVLINH